MKVMTMILAVFMYVAAASADSSHSAMQHNHSTQEHQQTTPLTEAGNDIFGTIQEVITQLNANPHTDWSKVDLDALRAHLLDMQDMTVHVAVIKQKALKNGSQITIRPTTKRAKQAIKRVLSVHPAQLAQETNWRMQVKQQNDTYILTTTTKNPAEVNKIISLSYIGLMAYGNHHQPHHWAMATGENPHVH